MVCIGNWSQFAIKALYYLSWIFFCMKHKLNTYYISMMMGGTILYYTMGEKAFKWQTFFPLVCKNVDKELRHSSIPDIRIEIKLMAWKTIRQKNM